ncbi:MAG: nucleoside triphosphate pyrophosphohydrolase [Clostridia bacterium]
MVNFIHRQNYVFDDLVAITRILRSSEGCPWDREQTHKSIRMNFIEETYEAIEAIDNEDTVLLKEELGDVLAQVVFHSELESECGRFNVDDVADGICKKLILRHPHIFGDVTVSGSKEVLANWDDIKRVEKGHKTHSEAMDAVARSLPALMRAEKLQAKAKKAGFDWPDISGAFDKLSEEIAELQMAINENSNIEEEVGDVIFAAVNIARFLGVNPEQATSSASDKFLARFELMEKMSHENGVKLNSLTLDEMDKLWDAAKISLKVEGNEGI